ncbi:MAG: YCF48-related protein [bacterium]
MSSVVAILTLLVAAPAAAQWNTQSPVPTFLDVRGVAAPTAQRVFVATSDDSFDDGGALFESADGGATWVQRDVPFNLGEPLNGIFYLDSQRGWAYGNANYRTTDGGTTWIELPFLGSTYFMEFYTPAFGLATGNFDKYVSLDGGLSWNPSPNAIFAFDFADAQTGLGASADGIFRTTNGGTVFAPVFAGDASAVAFLSSSVAVAIVNGSFARSTDGGATWIAGASAAGRTDLTAVSANVVLAWGRSGPFPDFDDRVLRSSDGGQTWTDLGEVFAADAYVGGFRFTVVDAQTIVASNGEGDVFRSADAGLTWTEAFTSLGPRPSFFGSTAPVFGDALTGYFGYGAGFVIKTTDGGATWAQISSGAGESLNDIDRFANGNFIAVGESGTLLTSTGTSPWLRQPALTLEHLTAVDVVGAQGAVVVDQTGRVYRSADGGATWTAGATAPVGLNAADLHFSTLLDGWVIGSGFAEGALFHTTNGGDSWTPVTDFMGGYASIDFEGPNGWAANVGGIFYRTTNAGATWTQGQLPGAFSITDMEFFNANTGFAVGSFGYAARSTNGGATWQTLPTPNSNHGFSDIHVVSANELWVSTGQDVAYHSATGGLSWSVLDIGSPGFGYFSAIVADSLANVWTVGFLGAIEHYTGSPPPPVNQPPVAAFTFDATGLSVDFVDASTDPDGIVVSWQWDFGDGEVSAAQNPTHVFQSANTYIVRLIATDDDAAADTTGAIIVVQPGPGGTFGDFTEVTPLDPLFVTGQDEDFWVITTASADYDGDGDLDMAVAGYYVVYNQSVVDRLLLLRNDGPAAATEWDFSYIELPPGTLTMGASDLAWGDADADGDQDLALGTDGATVIFRNDSGTLVLTNTALPGYYEDNDQADFDLRSITWADYDNDGDFDLLLPSTYDESAFEFRTALMRNDGPNGTGGWLFTQTDSTFAPTSHAQSMWADFDGDEDLDLLLVNLAPLTDDGFIRRYRNDGGGVFVGEDILGSLTIEHGEAQWGDYDGDGDLDILVAGNIGETDGTFTWASLRIYRNDAETYAPIEVIECVPCEGWFDFTAATWADYDSDGDVDILLAGNYNSGSQIEGRAKVYDNNGGVFVDSGNQLPAPRASGTRGGTFTWLDLDGEGDLDYFIAGQYFVPGGNGLVEAQMHVYRNDAAGQNAPPSAPSNVTVRVTEPDGELVIAWTPAIDDLTPASALTYDLVLRRGGVPVASPRHFPEPGRLSNTNRWVLADLPNGYYTWSLRAVDSAYNGGPVATGAFIAGSPVGVETSGSLPRDYAFNQSLPNPFKGSTTFHFALPERASVDLSVYDTSGRLVTRLVDEARAPGVYAIPWDASGLASGVYFARMSTAAFTKTQRVMLVK